LGNPDEGEPPQYVAAEESLVSGRTLRVHQTGFLVEAYGGGGEPASFRDLTNGQQVLDQFGTKFLEV